MLLAAHQEICHNSNNIENVSNEEELNELDEMLLHYQNKEDIKTTCHNENQLENLRPNVIQYAPAANINVTLHTNALPGKVVTHFKIDNAKLKLEDFVNNAKPLVVVTLQNELRRLKFIKFGILLDAVFTNIQNETSIRGFLTKNRTIMFASDIDLIVSECFGELLNKLQEHEGRGSGWSLLEITGLDVRVHKHGYGMRGSSYIPLPKKITNTKSCVNVQNENAECFKYAMLAKYVKENAIRPSVKYQEVEHKYNFVGMNYSVSIKDVTKFENQNPTASVNVYHAVLSDIYQEVDRLEEVLCIFYDLSKAFDLMDQHTST